MQAHGPYDLPLTLVIVSGPPGTGKTTIGEALARCLHAPIFSKDQLEAALRRSEVSHAQSGWAAYELLTTLARVQLSLGCSVVLDSVATFQRIRDEWLQLADAYGAAVHIIETYCSDRRVHRERLQGRKRGIANWPELSWDDVLEVESRYEPWTAPRLRVDAVDSMELVLDRARTYVMQVADRDVMHLRLGE